jgi:phage/plasmid primase-like uncharacterized protein
MVERPDVFFVGLSATPWAKGMGLLWQDLVIPCTVTSLIEQGFLSRFRVYAPDVPDLSAVRVDRGEYAEAQLAELMGDAKLVGSVVQTWLERGEDRPTLVFGVNRAHAAQLCEEFISAGIAAAYVDGTVDGVMRGRIAGQFRAGEVRVICSVRTMTTGVDLPVSCICDAAPTRSEMLHCQKIGRGLRVNRGTEDLVVFDHAGNSLRLGLITDIHHDELDRSKPGQRMQSDVRAERLPKPCPGCGALHAGRICPTCGTERRPFTRIDEADGNLVEITSRRPISTSVKSERLAGLKWIARQRGYKPGWAAQQFRNWHGVWPANGMNPAARAPSQEVTNWVKSQQIRWAKSQARAGACQMWHEKTTEAARGRWRGILATMGIPETHLKGKHGPCPLCGEGKDRFRFDDREGKGSWICNRCGAGDGMALAMRFTGLPFADAAARVDEIIRNVKPDVIQPKRELTERERLAALRALWSETRKAEDDDLLSRYLASRGISVDVPDDLRFAPRVRDGEGGIRPAIVALVRDAGGKPVTLHRTFLKPDGSGKAEMASPRKLMPGPVPDGSAVRLGPLREEMGIAEGIETALAASMLFEIPVWSTLSTALMASWNPPAGVSTVYVFADFDAAYGGQAAAYALAHRISSKVKVKVRLPQSPGDWNDVVLAAGFVRPAGETAP